MLRGWYWSKWLTFSFAALLQLSSGLGYTFSIYSTDLKKHFRWGPAAAWERVHATQGSAVRAMMLPFQRGAWRKSGWHMSERSALEPASGTLGLRAAVHKQGRCGVGIAAGRVLRLSPVAGRSYSQAQIAGIGTACNVGGYMPIVAGLFYDRLKRYNS